MKTAKKHPAGQGVYYIKITRHNDEVRYHGPYSTKGAASSAITNDRHQYWGTIDKARVVVCFTMTNETEV
jgi:hypothetical protein